MHRVEPQPQYLQGVALAGEVNLLARQAFHLEQLAAEAVRRAQVVAHLLHERLPPRVMAAHEEGEGGVVLHQRHVLVRRQVLKHVHGQRGQRGVALQLVGRQALFVHKASTR